MLTLVNEKWSNLTRQRPKLFLGLLIALMLMSSAFMPAQQRANTSVYESDVAVAWFDLSLKLVQETAGFTPPVASRAFGYLGVTLYETVQPGMPGYQSLVGQLNELERLPKANLQANFHWPSAANAALASSLRKFFPTATPANLAAIEEMEARFAQRYQSEVDGPTYKRSVVWGRSIANAIFTWSSADGGHEGYSRNFVDSYIPPAGAGLWVSTPPGYAKALQPYWGNNRPFVLAAGDTCPAPAPYQYSEDPNSRFYFEALEVYLAGKERTREHTDIARFWADDPGRTSTPAGHWISILSQTLQTEGAQLSVAAEAYAKLGMAVSDAFITCWHTKFVHNVVRPITYIQAHIDPSWNTPDITDVVGTPPFPEYTSGHSVQSGASAFVLTSLFGDDYAFVDNTHLKLGMPGRPYRSFFAAADEAALSRLYGGIHYRSAIENGIEQGKCVGEHILSLKFYQ